MRIVLGLGEPIVAEKSAQTQNGLNLQPSQRVSAPNGISSYHNVFPKLNTCKGFKNLQGAFTLIKICEIYHHVNKTTRALLQMWDATQT